MTRHGANLVLSISPCELAPGAPRLQGARPLSNRGMFLVGHFSDLRRCPLFGRYQGESGVRRETGKE
jgi:hypothetical protein